jgi:hypothetical protein
MSASRDCQGDRLAAEESATKTETEMEMETETENMSYTPAAALEVRLIPNVVGAVQVERS